MNIRKQFKRRQQERELIRASFKPESYSQAIRHRAKHLKPGTVIETCGLDVAVIIEVDGDDLEYKRLFGAHPEGTTGCCSVLNCGPVRLSHEAIEKRKEIYNRKGFEGLLELYTTGKA